MTPSVMMARFENPNFIIGSREEGKKEREEGREISFFIFGTLPHSKI
jgi:hypothetical protein